MSAAQAGLGITITMVASFVFAYPLGRIVDRMGAEGKGRSRITVMRNRHRPSAKACR